MERVIPSVSISLDTSFVTRGPSEIAFAQLLDDHSSALDILNQKFIDFIGINADEPALSQTLVEAQQPLAPEPDSTTLIAIAKHLEHFLAALFKLTAKSPEQDERISALLKLKWKFVKRKGTLLHPASELSGFDNEQALQTLRAAIAQAGLPFQTNINGSITDECFGAGVLHWQSTNNQVALNVAAKFAAWAAQTDAGRAQYAASVLFSLPEEHSTEKWLAKFDLKNQAGRKVFQIKPVYATPRIGFDLTEKMVSGAQADLQSRDQADYCLKCHKTNTDSCSHGIDKTHQGCPLHEKISEFLSLQSEGFSIAALAMIVRDNPMLAATGHRICNDCSLACVFQHQTPVDIPMAETQVLRHVLAMPWGFEIYALLTRWNPLNTRLPQPNSPSLHTVLVAGMGPAGFTLAHHLLQHGHSVIGIDGLKMQRLPDGLAAKLQHREPILNIGEWFEPLGNRPAYGFGGVAEYGITSRWEKNYLTIIRLLLERRQKFAMYGDIRLGGSLTIAQAFESGFSHVACALGAGAPKLAINGKNALPNGVKSASDFLMALHSAGARKTNATTNLQIRMPIVVIGGGLTGVDAATEALAYYPLQVKRYATLFNDLRLDDKTRFENAMAPQDQEVHHEFLAHAATFASFECLWEAPRDLAKKQFLDELGGATLIYRKALTQSPAFQLNRDELEKALQEGIRVEEGIRPVDYIVDEYGSVTHLKVAKVASTTDEFKLAAKCILFAVGTLPNDMIRREEPNIFVDGLSPKNSFDKNSFEMARMPDGRWVSMVGDLHPDYAGSVVKAMASAKAAAPMIDASLRTIFLPQNIAQKSRFDDLKNEFINDFSATVSRVVHHSPGIAEIYLHAPAAAQQFKPGQFYRLQSLFDDSIEPLAMTGASVNAATGELSVVVLGLGTSSVRSTHWPVGKQVSLMGPTGSPTDIPANKKVLLIGGGLGNAVLFSIGKAMRNNGCHVTYFAGYRKASDVFTPERIEAAADMVVWCCDEPFTKIDKRQQDKTFIGNVVQAIAAHVDLLTDIDHLLVIGSDRMMAAVAGARQNRLASSLGKVPLAIASINSPMQCMMKAICGQCLQEQTDPETGETSYVFSCLQQDQKIDNVNFNTLAQRLSQNRLTEQLSFAIEMRRHHDHHTNALSD
jgi:NADPH-dependent glutamate synthase beta subunit-like oxidoreductase/NAD(P)H-flavin reductase